MSRVVYQHYKTVVPGQALKDVPRCNLYEIICHALDEKSVTPLVVYRNLGQNTIWARMEEEFYGDVVTPNGTVPRFTPHNITKKVTGLCAPSV